VATLFRFVAPAANTQDYVRLPIGQADLAKLAGLSRNNVSRLLGTLAGRGYVQRRYNAVVIDVERLKTAMARHQNHS
jgi:DNA-binding IclR family transcriptional regulator